MSDGVSWADPSESVAVMIGVGRCRTDLPLVPQAGACVRGVVDAFTDPKIWGLRPPLAAPGLVDPDRATVLETVGRAARQAGPAGLLVIYFVGHAEVHGEHLCLVPADGDRSRPVASMVTVANLVDEVSRNKRDVSVVLVLDCCFAGHAEL